MKLRHALAIADGAYRAGSAAKAQQLNVK